MDRVPVNRVVRWIVPAIVLAVLLVLGRSLPVGDWLRTFMAWVSGLGPEAFVLYAAAYAVVTVLLLPAWLMTIGAGLLFGLLPGVAVVSVGSTAGAAAAFLIGRYLARDRVAAYVAKSSRFAAIDRAIGAKGWKIVFLLRLSPLVPFVVSNYFYGVTAIRFWPYVLASWIGMVPLQFLYVALGVAGREASMAEGAGSPAPWKWALLAAGVLLTLVATLYVARVAQREIAAARSTEKP